MALKRRTPCVGICSTTYGDLVCRGCKRFAHEIVQWNSYDAEQQGRVWQRLQELRDSVVRQHLKIADASVFAQACEAAGIAADPSAEAMYAVMKYLVSRDEILHTAGLTAHGATLSPLAALQAIDAEIYARSLAHYERNFRIPV